MSQVATFSTAQVDVSVSARIENAPPTPCQWETGNRMFIPQRVVVDFGHITTVRVSGPRIVKSCTCDCHGRDHGDDDSMPDYSITYYPGNESKRPPQWIADWMDQVSATVRKSGVLS